MAEGLSVIQAVRRRDFQTRIPVDAEEEQWLMEGAEPEVQLFNGTTEEKTSPNYSDYLSWKESATLSKTVKPKTALAILREAYSEDMS